MPTNEERIDRVEELLDNFVEQLNNPPITSDGAKGLSEQLELTARAAEIDAVNNARVGDNHLGRAEQVIVSLAALKTIKQDEVSMLKAILGDPQ